MSGRTMKYSAIAARTWNYWNGMTIGFDSEGVPAITTYIPM